MKMKVMPNETGDKGRARSLGALKTSILWIWDSTKIHGKRNILSKEAM